MNLYNSNLHLRLNALEEEFKTNNQPGYLERQRLKCNIIAPKVSSFGSMGVFTIEFTNKNSWKLISAAKHKMCAFHANDVTRLQYLEYAKITPDFMGYLPSKVILDNIVNADTKYVLDNVTTTNDLLEMFNNTIHGKRIKYLFNDFGLKIASIKMERPDKDYYQYNITLNTVLS
ncbi:hypothetical protein ACFX5K_05585 [Rickettsiales bacterium LUAb2]